MRVVLLCNVGNRDLLDGDTPLNRVRPDGEQLLTEVKADAGRLERLSAPIITTALDYLLRIEPARTSGKVDELVLFSTDQSAETAERFRDQDTVAAAQVIDRLLKQRYDNKLGKVRRQSIRSNPADFDGALEFYGDQLQRLAGEAGADETEWYFSLTGGTPAMNTGLLLAAVERLGERCRPLYLTRDARHPAVLNIAARLVVGERRARAEELLNAFDFAAARDVLKQMEASDDLICLCRSAEARLHFDFGRAWDAANRGLQRCRVLDRDALVRWRDAIDLLQSGDRDAALVELVYNAEVVHARKQWTDFLARGCRVQEELLVREVCERHLGLASGSSEHHQVAAIQQAAANDSNLKAGVEAKWRAARNQDLEWKNASTPLLLTILEHLVENEPPGDRTRLHAALAVWEKPKQLRNRSIIAHGFRGVDEDGLAAALGATKPLTALRDAAVAAGLAIGPNPFADARDRVLCGLRS